MTEKLRIYFRKRQLVKDNVNVVVQCTGDNKAEYVPGTISPNEFVDMTEYTTGLEKLSVSWDYVNTGSAGGATETSPGGSNYDKGVSLDLTFNDKAFEFIFDWLLSSPCGILNAIEVRVEDLLCRKRYRLFELKADNLTYQPFDAPCEVEVKLREADPVWHCVHKTFIWDNWQGWFMDGSSKQHPCFFTCIEPRPRLITSARLGLSIFGHTIPVISTIFNENQNYARRILNTDNFVDAPLIRDIISNACDKCGLTYDTIFHDPASPYYNTCLYYPSTGAWHTNDGSALTSPALWFHLENRWNITLAELLDKLKIMFKSEWYVTPNNMLVFKHKTVFQDTVPIYDFTQPNALPMWELEYTFDGTKKPAYGRYQLQVDASDLASQEIAPLYNDLVGYDTGVDNPMLEGSASSVFEFAPTGFVRDGRAREDYLERTIREGRTVAFALVIVLGVIISALFAGTITVGAAAALSVLLGIWAININILGDELIDYFKGSAFSGAVRLISDQTASPRLLVWDGISLNRAKTVARTIASIEPSDVFNPSGDAYDEVNNFQYTPAGIYNYDLYFDSKFKNNLYDRFHDSLDNPLHSLDTHQRFKFFSDLCCEMLDLLGAWEGDHIKIGSIVKLEQRDGYEVLGRLEHIEISEDDQRILLRGKVIFKKT